jgi:hypothetical protein
MTLVSTIAEKKNNLIAPNKFARPITTGRRKKIETKDSM